MRKYPSFYPFSIATFFQDFTHTVASNEPIFTNDQLLWGCHKKREGGTLVSWSFLVRLPIAYPSPTHRLLIACRNKVWITPLSPFLLNPERISWRPGLKWWTWRVISFSAQSKAFGPHSAEIEDTAYFQCSSRTDLGWEWALFWVYLPSSISKTWSTSVWVRSLCGHVKEEGLQARSCGSFWYVTIDCLLDFKQHSSWLARTMHRVIVDSSLNILFLWVDWYMNQSLLWLNVFLDVDSRSRPSYSVCWY